MDLNMHLPTLLVTSVMINLLIGGMLWAIYHLRHREGCFLLWALACLTFVIGTALAVANELADAPGIFVFIAHLVLGGSPLLVLAGIQALMGLPIVGTRRSSRIIYGASLLYLFGLAVGTGWDPLVARFLTALFSALVFSLAIYRLGSIERRPRLPLRILQTLFGVHGTLMMAQVLVIAVSVSGSTQLDLQGLLKLILVNHLLLVSATAMALPLLAFTRAEQALVALAERDGLTQLFNRRAFYREGNLAFEKAREEGKLITVLMIDLDHFKQINDRWGHATGDEVLRIVANLMKAELRDDDIIGRVGGEEFAAVLRNNSREAIEAVTERLLQRISEAGREVDGIPVHLSASIGGASLTQEHGNFQDIMVSADKALYRAKRNGRNRAVFVPASAAAKP
ncbi:MULTISPECIES: GGDEF domain-containing protein [unclassified Marinobacter]|jgi:diguanylate cyclase (GGDEF)-like protein|uniref:GGDEF domain-containing protein n=1 Tax=unclassified Marinobacter TaxID=83889 RepID=UPI001926C863|nr:MULTISPECIES: GGDEF domain-containing protein [unclassified Marinobacter]MBL3823973.1 diguanylate cyclase [Marinobacter sp. MC3]MBL3892129.1 diguanylate cyclase [Marinobacter sp. MW3]